MKKNERRIVFDDVIFITPRLITPKILRAMGRYFSKRFGSRIKHSIMAMTTKNS